MKKKTEERIRCVTTDLVDSVLYLYGNVGYKMFWTLKNPNPPGQGFSFSAATYVLFLFGENFRF